MYNFLSREADVLFICQQGTCQNSMPSLGVVEIWVRKSLVEVNTSCNANEAFAPSWNVNLHALMEHHNIQLQNPNDYVSVCLLASK